LWFVVVLGTIQLIELAEGVTVDDVKNATTGELEVSPNLIPMRQ
jgi:acyl CoA:acetate/3-ketoacid CoA transferase beta subunit